MDKILEEDIKTIVKNLEDFRDKIKEKTFLVTGGAGFLGSWFCDTLNAFNANIICVDNLSSGSEKNIEHLKRRTNFKFINQDVCEFETDEKIDYIVHMASIASTPLYQEKPVETLDSNVIGTKKMLELARKNNVKGFLFTSTSEVYGNPPDDKIPTEETYYGYVNPYGPRAMYDEGKRAAEAYCYSFLLKSQKEGKPLPIRIARIFNTFGPRLDIKVPSLYGRVLIKFVHQALNGQPVTVYTDGKQTRSFCYITDQIIGLFKLLLTSEMNGEVFNIGDNKEISILDLAEIIIELTNSNSQIVFDTIPVYNIEDDPRRRCPNISKANKFLNFYPKISLERGLKRTVEWTKQNM